MKTSPWIARMLTTLALLLPVLTSCATASPAVPDQRLIGHWEGLDRFGGMSRDEIVKQRTKVQDVETELTIAPDGRVTGHVGGAELSGGTVEANRGWLGRTLHLKTDFIIRGRLYGAVALGSEAGIHEINAPFNLAGTRIDGTLFVIRGAFEYPYPTLRLRLAPKSGS